MEGMGLMPVLPQHSFWRGKRVLVTGHTGFKGGWIALWLSEMGAKVYGYALAPPTTPSFFSETQLESHLEESWIGDVRDLTSLSDAVQLAKPNVVIHMAAQPLVRESYRNPVETYSTNVIGTVNLLETTRYADGVKSIVIVTTDKCYENQEWIWPYREDDRLGGYDPYSSSKACAEIAAAAYRNSYHNDKDIQVATVRAGNVIGGGDWARDRLLPDFLRAIDAGRTLRIRSPSAIRPWQHVLEPICGYLALAENMVINGSSFAGSWNFGPEDRDTKTVAWIVKRMCGMIPGAKWEIEAAPQPHEAGLLRLDSSKSKALLGWSPRWRLETALDRTIDWHNAWRRGENMADYSIEQIKGYSVV